MKELFHARWKAFLPLVMWMMLVAGVAGVAATPPPSYEKLALLCRLNLSVPVAEQMLALADGITAASANIRRLADTINAVIQTPFNSAMGITNASSTPLTPPSTTPAVQTPVTPPPELFLGDRDATPPAAPHLRSRKTSWLRCIVENLERVVKRHPFFAVVTGCAILLTITTCFGVLMLPHLFDALEERCLRGRVLLIFELIFAIALGAWTVDNLSKWLCAGVLYCGAVLIG
ncbi:uncharacterized protein LOC129581154 [Paramacrobiotus metropolitanus]|uniref:uncharacterized protein LOC129581154 n=1 Tax=Paramacrobiotus metropolitanus TaxID=2943436 RepID=UPI0024461E7A|nr:uncharacterized protein LOC129581154 [Paramacrobiotus metropolitanus]